MFFIFEVFVPNRCHGKTESKTHTHTYLLYGPYANYHGRRATSSVCDTFCRFFVASVDWHFAQKNKKHFAFFSCRSSQSVSMLFVFRAKHKAYLLYGNPTKTFQDKIRRPVSYVPVPLMVSKRIIHTYMGHILLSPRPHDHHHHQHY